MRPDTLFDRHVRHSPFLGPRYRSTAQLPLEGRTILRQLFDVACASPDCGVYRPDVERDGEQPLPYHVARAIDAHDAEAVIERVLPTLVKLDFLKITTEGCIVFDYLCKKPRIGAGRGAQPGVRTGGAKGGRPPSGETAASMYARRDRERQAQPSLMLPITGGALIPDTEIAERLKAPLRVVELAEPVWETETEAETGRETETETRSVSAAVFSSSPGSSRREDDEEEGAGQTPIESEIKEVPLPSSSSSSARASDAKTETVGKLETETAAKPETETGKLKTDPAAAAPSLREPSRISQPAVDLAHRYRKRWGDDAPGLKEGPRVFQDRLDEGWTAEQLRDALDVSNKPRSGPIYYGKVLTQLFHGPGQGRREERGAIASSSSPSPPPPPRGLGPPWEARWATYHQRLEKSLGSADYRAWVKTLVLIGVEGAVAKVWSPTQFTSDYVRTTWGDQLTRILPHVIPELKSLDYSWGHQALKQAG